MMLLRTTKLPLLLGCLLVFGLSSKAACQVGVTEGWGLASVTCQQGIFGIPFTLPLNDAVPPFQFCGDNQVSQNFGHVFIQTAGTCENGINLEPMTLQAAWTGCSITLAGTASARTAVEDVSLPVACADNIQAGATEGNAIVLDFFQGTVIAAGLGGFTNCAGEFQGPIAPSIGSC
jgi:hypothetical protein